MGSTLTPTSHRLGTVFDFLRRLFSSSPAPAPAQDRGFDLAAIDAEWLIVGLGNPGAQYAATRHNVGYMALDELIDAPLQPLPGIKAHGLMVPDTNAFAVRSTTYMNLSGEGIAPVAEKLGIPPERIVVLHDELDLPAGKVRVKLGGNENGHNGLKSLTEHWRQIASNFHMHDVREQLGFIQAMEMRDGFNPMPHRATELAALCDRLEEYAGKLRG